MYPRCFRSPSGRTYRVEHELGRGGFGVVLAVRDDADLALALKLIPASHADDEVVGAWRAEVVNQLRCSTHPNVVRCMDVFAIPTIGLCIVMERALCNVRELLRRGPLPLRATCDVGIQIADALCHFEEMGVVHRDIRTRNILVFGPTTYKVCDFGLAEQIRSRKPPTWLGYMRSLPPEVICGLKSTPASDLYQLGLVLLECLTAELPIPRNLSEATTCDLIRSAAPQRRVAVLPQKFKSQRRMRKLLNSLLSDVGERPQSGCELIGTLLRIKRKNQRDLAWSQLRQRLLCILGK